MERSKAAENAVERNRFFNELRLMIAQKLCHTALEIGRCENVIGYYEAIADIILMENPYPVIEVHAELPGQSHSYMDGTVKATYGSVWNPMKGKYDPKFEGDF